MSTSAQVMDLFNIFAKTYSKEEAQKIVQDIEEIIDSRKQDLATKGDLFAVKAELKDDIKQVELKIEQAKSSTIKWLVGWMVALIIAQTAAITTIFLLLK
jgi:thiaminase